MYVEVVDPKMSLKLFSHVIDCRLVSELQTYWFGGTAVGVEFDEFQLECF